MNILVAHWMSHCVFKIFNFNECVELCFVWYNIKKQVLFVFTRYIDYIVQVIRLLQASDIKPIAVFDGNKLNVNKMKQTQTAESNVNRSRESYSFNNLYNNNISHCDQNISFFILIFSYCMCNVISYSTRKDLLRKGKAVLYSNDKTAAAGFFQKALKVTWNMVLTTIKVFKL